MKANAPLPKRTTNAVLALISLLFAANPVLSQTNQSIYTDSLQNNWQDWGWAQISYDNTSPVHSGSMSISVTITGGWQAIYLFHAPFDSSPFANLTFWLNGGTSGRQGLGIQGHAGGAAQTVVTLTPPTANAWTKYTVSLASIGVANRTDMDGFWIQDRIGAAQPTFYLDGITLSVIPEPSTFALVGLGAASLMLPGRRR
jgi:alpha-L-arabinofuranosidase